MKTKFMKNLSLLLAASMVTAGITIPATADDTTMTETTLVDKNFEDCTSLDDTGFSFWPAVGLVEGENAVGQLTSLEDKDGSKVLKITTSDMTTGDPWYSNAAQVTILENMEQYTDGYMNVTFDVAPGLRGDQANFMFYFRTKDGENNVDITLPHMVWDQAILNSDWDLKVCDVTPGAWYTIINEFDFANKTVTTDIRDRENGTKLGEKTYTYTTTPSSMYFNQFDSKNEGLAEKRSSYVDNVKVVYSKNEIDVPEPSPSTDPDPSPSTDPKPAGIEWEDNFDSYTSNTDLTSESKYWIPTDWGVDANTVSIASNGAGKGLKLAPATEAQSVLVRDINGETTGKVGIDVEVTPGSANDNKLVISDSSWKGETIVSFNNDAINIRQKNEQNEEIWDRIGSFTQGETYKVRIIADLDTDKIDVAVTDKDNKTVRGSFAYTGTDIGKFQMAVGAWNNTVGYAVFDNLKITANPTALPDASPVETEDPTAKKTLWEDNFEGYANIDGVKAKYENWPKEWRSSVTEENGSKVLSVMPNDKVDSSIENQYPDWQQRTAQFYKTFENAATGRYGFSFSVKPASTGNTNFILRDGNGYEIMAPRFAGQTVLLGTDQDCWNNTIGQIKAGTWYDVNMVLDLDNDKLEIEVKDKDGNTLRGEQEYTGGFNCFVMGVYSEEYNGAMFDNLKVVKNPDDLPEYQELPFTDNFDSYTSIADAGVNWICWAPENNTNPSKIVEGKGGASDKAYYLGLSQGADNTDVKKQFSKKITTGRLNVEFDIKPGDNVSTHVKFNTEGTGNADYKGFLPLMYFENGSVGTAWNWLDNNTNVGTYTPNEWYHCSAEVDFDGGTIKVLIESPSGSIQRKTVNYEELRQVDYDSITAFAIQEYGATSAAVGSTFDNVKIEYVVADPKFDATGVSFATGDTISTDSSKVPTSIDKILLDFGTTMDLTTFGEMTLKDENGNAVPYELSTVKGKVAIVLKEALQALTKYTLHVPDTAENIKGTELGISEDVTFTTGEGRFTGTLSEIKKGETKVTNVSQLSAGDELTTSVNFTNATLSAQKAVIIYSYYKADGTMKETKYDTIDVAANQKITKEMKHVVGDLTDVTEIKVMLWDNFETIRPLSPSISLN